MFTFRYDETRSNLFVACDQLGIRSLEISEARQWIIENKGFSAEQIKEALTSLRDELYKFTDKSYADVAAYNNRMIEAINNFPSLPVMDVRQYGGDFIVRLCNLRNMAIATQAQWVTAQLYYHQYNLLLELDERQRQYHDYFLRLYTDLLLTLNQLNNKSTTTPTYIPQDLPAFEHYRSLLDGVLASCRELQQALYIQQNHTTRIIDAHAKESTMAMAYTYAVQQMNHFRNPAVYDICYRQYYNGHYQYNAAQESSRHTQIFELFKVLSNFSVEEMITYKNAISCAVLAEQQYVLIKTTISNDLEPPAPPVNDTVSNDVPNITTPPSNNVSVYTPQVFACAHRGWGVADNGQWEVKDSTNIQIASANENTVESHQRGIKYCKITELDVKVKPLRKKSAPVLLVEHTELDDSMEPESLRSKKQNGEACNPTPARCVTTFENLVTNLRHDNYAIEMQVEIKQEDPRKLVLAILDAYATAYAKHNGSRNNKKYFPKISLLLPSVYHEKLNPKVLKDFTIELHNWAISPQVQSGQLNTMLNRFMPEPNPKDNIKPKDLLLQQENNLKSALFYNKLIAVAAPVATSDLFSKKSIGKGFRLKERLLSCEVKEGIEQVKTIIRDGCDLDLLLFDIDTDVIHAIRDASRSLQKKPRISLSATHSDMRADRREEIGPIYAAARALAIARQSGCDVLVKTDRADIFANAIEIVNILEMQTKKPYKKNLDYLRFAECDIEQAKREIVFFKLVRPSTMRVVPELQKWTRKPNEEMNLILWEDAEASNYLRLAVPEGTILSNDFVFARTCSNPRQPNEQELAIATREKERRMSMDLISTLRASTSGSYGAVDLLQTSTSGGSFGNSSFNNGPLTPMLGGTPTMTYAKVTMKQMGNRHEQPSLMESQSMPEEVSRAIFGASLDKQPQKSTTNKYEQKKSARSRTPNT